jgi:hypothetical protein
MKKFKMSFFDIAIIAVVAVIAIGAVGVYYMKQKNDVAKGSTIKYVLELNDNPIGFSELIKVGDKLSDNVKNYYMGKVAAVEVVPNMKIGSDLVNGKMIETELTSKEKVLVTVEATVNDTGSDLLIDGLYDVRVGKEVYLKGDGYAGVGYILKVER